MAQNVADGWASADKYAWAGGPYEHQPPARYCTTPRTGAFDRAFVERGPLREALWKYEQQCGESGEVNLPVNMADGLNEMWS